MTEPSPRFAEILAAPFPEVTSLDSTARLARVALYREMTQAGVTVPPEHLRFAVTLITMDRASRATEARAASKAAKVGVNAQTVIPSVEDL